jgi:hypothetical protein
MSESHVLLNSEIVKTNEVMWSGEPTAYQILNEFPLRHLLLVCGSNLAFKGSMTSINGLRCYQPVPTSLQTPSVNPLFDRGSSGYEGRACFEMNQTHFSFEKR